MTKKRWRCRVGIHRLKQVDRSGPYLARDWDGYSFYECVIPGCTHKYRTSNGGVGPWM